MYLSHNEWLISGFLGNRWNNRQRFMLCVSQAWMFHSLQAYTVMQFRVIGLSYMHGHLCIHRPEKKTSLIFHYRSHSQYPGLMDLTSLKPVRPVKVVCNSMMEYTFFILSNAKHLQLPWPLTGQKQELSQRYIRQLVHHDSYWGFIPDPNMSRLQIRDHQDHYCSCMLYLMAF